jgi:hypothetical protein
MREAANFKVPTTGNNNRLGLGGGASQHPKTMLQAANSKQSVKSNKVPAVPVKYTGPVTMRKVAAIVHQEKKKKRKEHQEKKKQGKEFIVAMAYAIE